MTVIVYRAGVMAADTMTAMDYGDNSVKFLADRKIIRRQGYLLGAAGEIVPEPRDLTDWFFEHEGERRRPRLRSFDFEVLVITPSGKLQVWSHRGDCVSIVAPYFAIGSGQEYALGALAAGATAYRAVAIAIKYCTTCGGRVTAYRVPSHRRKK